MIPEKNDYNRFVYLFQHPSANKASFNEPQRGWYSLYPSWPLRSFFFCRSLFYRPSRIRNKYYAGNPCQLCPTTPCVSLSLPFCLDEKSQCANIRSDLEFHDRPLGVVTITSYPTHPLRSRVLENP